MNPLLAAVLLVVGGLGICFLSSYARGVLATIFWWFGILVAVLGLIMGLFPVIAFIYKNLREALAV